MDGNLRFAKMSDGHWQAFDERDSWLGGYKPVGGA